MEIKHAHDHTPSLKENTKIQKILLIALIVISSVFISGCKVNALTPQEQNDLIDLITTNGTAVWYKYNSHILGYRYTDSQMKKLLANFNEYYFISTTDLMIVSSSPITFNFTENGYSFSGNSDICLDFNSSSTYGDYWSYSTFDSSTVVNISPSFISSMKENFSANYDVYNSKGEIVFLKPVEPLISHQLVAVLPEMIVADSGMILPVGLVLLSMGLLIFLLIRWRKSLSL